MRKINVDIVIIGGGPAGLAAAMSAYEQGISSENILILERDVELGGSFGHASLRRNPHVLAYIFSVHCLRPPLTCCDAPRNRIACLCQASAEFMMAERVSRGYRPYWCFQIRLFSCYFDMLYPKMKHCAANKNRTGATRITQSGDAHWVILNGRAPAFAPCRAPTKRYGNPIQTLASTRRAGGTARRELFCRML